MSSTSATAAAGDRSPHRLLGDPEFLAWTSVRFVVGMAFATISIAPALYANLFAVSGLVAGLFGTAYAAIRLFVVCRWAGRSTSGTRSGGCCSA